MVLWKLMLLEFGVVVQLMVEEEAMRGHLLRLDKVNVKPLMVLATVKSGGSSGTKSVKNFGTMPVAACANPIYLIAKRLVWAFQCTLVVPV